MTTNITTVFSVQSAYKLYAHFKI